MRLEATTFGALPEPLLANGYTDLVPAVLRDGGDQITVLKSAGGLLLAKRWLASGALNDYDNVKNFRVKQVPVAGIVELSALLTKLEARPDHCIIRGGFVGAAEAQRLAPPEIAGHYVRQNPLFPDRPLHMMLVDADGFRTEKTGLDAVLEYIETVLPPEFQGISFHWQLSSSAGHPRNAGVLKAHIWFWLETPRSSAELRAWALRIGPQVDKSVYQQVQVHYTAAPVFDEGVEDPITSGRSGFYEGWLGDEVDLVLPEGLAIVPATGGVGDKTYPDARAKPGLIGAFNRAYTMDEVWEEFLPGQFERVPGSDRRVTWHGGGGAAEGAFVDDSDEWLVNTHNTDPAGGRASCKWDLVRLYLFGDRDSAEVKADTFVVTALPSHQTMVEMASRLPRVAEELSSTIPDAQAVENPAEGALDPVAGLERNLIKLGSLSVQPDVFLPHWIDMLIPQDELTLLSGHGGSGKTYVSLHISVNVVLGIPFGPLQTTQTNVLYFSCEDGAPVLRQRLGRLCRALNVDSARLDGRLHILDASDIDPALYREQKAVVSGRRQTVTETLLLDALAGLVQKLDVGLVVIDNASDAFDGDEIKRAQVRTFVRSLRSRIARPGRAVLLLAHINKASASGGRNAGSEDYSGSTAWHNSARSRLSLIPAGDNAMTIEHQKANLGQKAAPVRMEWHNGVPLVAGSCSGVETAANNRKATELEQDASDKAALILMIQDFDRRGEPVTTSFQGPVTVFKLLKTVPGFPKGMSSDRLSRLLRELESEGRIFRRTTKMPDRKVRPVFTCNAAPGIAPNAPDQVARVESENEAGAPNDLF